MTYAVIDFDGEDLQGIALNSHPVAPHSTEEVIHFLNDAKKLDGVAPKPLRVAAENAPDIIGLFMKEAADRGINNLHVDIYEVPVAERDKFFQKLKSDLPHLRFLFEERVMSVQPGRLPPSLTLKVCLAAPAQTLS